MTDAVDRNEFLPRLRLDGKVALIVGAGGAGMGMQTTLALAEAGAGLACVDYSEEAVAAVTDRLRGVRHRGIVANVAEPADIDRAVEETLEEFGRIDCLVNVVGGTRRHWHRTDSFPIEGFDEVFTLNLRYAFLSSQRVGRHMIERRGGGAIVNFSSAGSGITSAPYHGPYGAAKTAIASLTRTMAVEWGEFGIRVNAVAPGSVRTPSTGRLSLDMGDEAVARWLDPEEVASVVLFLLSDLSRGINGQTISVDGGLSIRPTLATTRALAEAAANIKRF